MHLSMESLGLTNILTSLLTILFVFQVQLISRTSASASSSVSTSAAEQSWIMPSTFSFTETSDFWWPIQEGTNLVGMWVRGVMDPGRGRALRLGSCAVPNILKQSCDQYVNNGTAQFGGIYAQGLTPGERYFISIVWITEDSSKNGTVSSPTFMMEYPEDPSPPTAAGGSAASKIVTGVVPAATAPSPPQDLNPTTLSTSTLSSTPTETPSLPKTPNSANSTLPTESSLPPQQEESHNHPLSAGVIAAITIGAIAFLLLLLACLLCHLRTKIRKRRAAVKEASNIAISKAGTTSYQVQDQQPVIAELRGGGAELPGSIWDTSKELPGSKGGVEMPTSSVESLGSGGTSPASTLVGSVSELVLDGGWIGPLVGPSPTRVGARKRTMMYELDGGYSIAAASSAPKSTSVAKENECVQDGSAANTGGESHVSGITGDKYCGACF